MMPSQVSERAHLLSTDEAAVATTGATSQQPPPGTNPKLKELRTRPGATTATPGAGTAYRSEAGRTTHDARYDKTSTGSHIATVEFGVVLLGRRCRCCCCCGHSASSSPYTCLS